MKKLTVFLFVILFSLPLYAQEEETIFNGKAEHGGFGGPVLKLTQIDKTTSLLIGGRGGWIINHSFVIGGGGYGLATIIDISAGGRNLRMAMGYGGLELEYIYNSNKSIHFTASALIGGGGVSWYDHYDDFWFDEKNDRKFYGSDAFFVFEPGLNIELNITKWMRIDVGGSYRLVSGVDSKLTYLGTTVKSLSNSDLSGFSGNLTFKFGAF